MAAPTVSATTTLNNLGISSSASINVPSGTQDGDILLLVAGSFTTTPSLVSGFTNIANIQTGSVSGTRSMYRVASSEPASYTVTFADANGGAAAMFRLTGDVTNLFRSDTEEDEASTDTTTKPSPSLLVMFGHSRDNIGASAYQITHGGSNPTWTELLDISATTPDQAFFVAYATTTDTSNITAWQYTESVSAINTAQLVVVLSTQNVTATTSHLAVSPAFYDTAASVGVTATNTHLTIVPDINTLSAKSYNNGAISNEAKPSTTWSNISKP